MAPSWLGGAIPLPPAAGIPPAGIPPAGISPPAMGGGIAPPPVRFIIDLPAGMAGMPAGAAAGCPFAPHGTHCIGGAGAPVAQLATAIQTVVAAICWPAGGIIPAPPAGGAAGIAPPAGMAPPVANAKGSICERVRKYFIVKKRLASSRVKSKRRSERSWQWALASGYRCSSQYQIPWCSRRCI